jgi:aldehyde:ferredoxin oxidoreductase
MGSKKIKAIIIEKATLKKEIDYFDKEKFTKATKKVVEAILANPGLQGMTKVGTLASIEATCPMGILPVHNFSGTYLEPDKFEKINAKSFVSTLLSRGGKNGVPCQPGCVVRCSNIFNNSKGEYVTSGLEYETIALNGPNCDINDLDYLAEVDKLCDDFGIDTMDLGASIALCMEAGKIQWGDGKAALGLIKEMYEGTEFGNLLGQGTDCVGKSLGVKRIPTVKGQAISGYDPRNLKGTGVTYATSTMGADHTCGITISNKTDHTKKDGQLQASIGAQFAMALCDNMMCVMAFGGVMSSQDILPDLMNGAYGGEWNFNKVMGIGYQTLAIERAFNRAAGFTDADDILPEFFYTEPSPATGAVFDISQEEISGALKAAGL